MITTNEFSERKTFLEKIKSVLAITLKNHYDLFSSESSHIGVLLNA